MMVGSPVKQRRSKPTVTALVKPALDQLATEQLLRAADAHDWAAVCQGLQQTSASDPVAIELRDQVLDVIARELTPTYHQRWSEQMGEFLVGLGLATTASPAEDILGNWVGERDIHECAQYLARQHLAWSAERNHVWSLNFVREHCSTGYRNTYLSQLRRLGEHDPIGLVAQIVDPATRAQQANTPTSEMLASQLSWEVWMRCWWQWKRARKSTPAPDGRLLVLNALSADLASDK